MDDAASNGEFRINVFNSILKHLQLGLYCLVSNKTTSTSHYLDWFTKPQILLRTLLLLLLDSMEQKLAREIKSKQPFALISCKNQPT